MNLNLHSKRGTTSVFLTIILASMLAVAGLFIYAASVQAGRSYADAVFELAGRSVLSEYDLALQERYGLFAVHTNESQAESKIKYYADYSFHDNEIKESLRHRDYIDTLKLELDSVSVNLKGYSITDTNLFEQQVLDDMKIGVIKGILSKEKAKKAATSQRVLRNEQVINSLPSCGYRSSIIEDWKTIAENGIPSLTESGSKAKDTYLVNEYIMNHFYNHQRINDENNSFFTNEVEYILKGNLSDESNYHSVRTDLFLMRNVLNLVHIQSDPQKMKQAETVAVIITLGEGEPVGIIAVIEAWAAAETENDLRLLEDGQKVPLIKTRANWAVPISNTLEYIWNDGYKKPSKIRGYDYEDYLRIFLFTEDQEKKLLRCMDLIQINMKGSSNGDFDLRECYGGLYFEAVAKGRTFTYDQKYL